MVSTDLRRTTGDGSCDKEWRSSRSMVESAFEERWSYRDKRGVWLEGFWGDWA